MPGQPGVRGARALPAALASPVRQIEVIRS